MIAAITQLFTLLNILLPEFISMVKAIKAYFDAQNQRIMDAEKANVDEQLKAASRQAKKEQANMLAYNATLDAAWKQIDENIFNLIVSHQENEVLALLNMIDNEEVNSILFPATEISPEGKARRIVQIMRRNRPEASN